MFHAWGWCNFSSRLQDVRRNGSRQLCPFRDECCRFINTHNLWLNDIQLCKNAPSTSSPVTNSHFYSAPLLSTSHTLSQAIQDPASRKTPHSQAHTPPFALLFPFSRPATDRRKRNDPPLPPSCCCWIVIRFRVDSWCGLSITLPNWSPHLNKMKSAS